MKYTAFHEQQFHQSVATAMETVRRILDVERHPVLAADEVHEYSDKYALVEYLTNTAIAAIINALTVAGGLQPDVQQTVLGWVQPADGATPQTVTLRFLAEDTCAFMHETEVEVVTGEHSYETVTTKSTSTSVGGFFGSTPKEKEDVTTTSRVVQRVKEFHWRIGIRYQLVLFPGTNMDQAVVLTQRQTEAFIVTQMGATARGHKVKPPLPEHTLHPPVDTNLTWLLRMIDPTTQACRFVIERDDAYTCATPRRNASVAAAVDCVRHLHDWSRIAHGYFVQRLEKEILSKDNPVQPRPPAVSAPHGPCLAKEPTFNGQQIRIVEYNPEQQRYKAEPVNPNAGLPATLSIKPGNIRPEFNASTSHAVPVSQGPPLHTITDQGLFCPILPLMEQKAVLGLSDVTDFLQEQSRSLDDAMDTLTRTYPARNLVKVVSVTEATLVLLCKHLEQLTVMYHDSVDYVEDLLKQQLVSAIGKEVTRADFEQFMKFYYPKFFGTPYAPVPFCHAIRRPGHYPDGIVSIEALPTLNGAVTTRKNESATTTATAPEPIATWVRRVAGSESPSLYIPIHASAHVEITGDRYLHGWMQHRFQSKPKPEYQLACRARQFSSFLIVLGTVAGPDKFDPKDAIILQNKDEVLIPLLTTVLPSAKEFKDAIHSLSPEQQDFAKAFRGMQLESSVFGICIVQIKPQLEKLLGLPNGALTKEIQLTQDLLSLFVDYQVPSDLMTFEGSSESTVSEKVETVREHVESIKSMIASNKTSQLKDERMKADMRYEMTSAPSGGLFDSKNMSGSIFGSKAEGCPIPGSSFGAPPTGFAVQSFAAPSTMALPAAQNYAVAEFDAGLAEGSEGASSSRSRVRVAASGGQARQSEGTERSALRKKASPTKSAAKPVVRAELSPTLEPYQSSGKINASATTTSGEDFTLIPKVLDAKLEEFELDSALRSTVIKAGATWTRTRQANFLTSPTTSSLGSTEVATERTKAFDLLDAISRSGTLAIDCAELHVFVALSHCFDNDVLGTVVQDNINPIAKVERSSLLLASTVHSVAMGQLIQHEPDRQRLEQSFPRLFALPSSEEDATEQG